MDGFLDIPIDVLVQDVKNMFETDVNYRTQRNECGKILTAARDAGLLTGKADKQFASPRISALALGYIIYSLKELHYPMGMIYDSPYVKSIVADDHSFRRLLSMGENSGFWNFNFTGDNVSLNLRYDTLKNWFEGVVM